MTTDENKFWGKVEGLWVHFVKDLEVDNCKCYLDGALVSYEKGNCKYYLDGALVSYEKYSKFIRNIEMC